MEDTADEVRDLRRRGIRVAAIFMGEQDNVPAADRIYGKDLTVSGGWISWPRPPGG